MRRARKPLRLLVRTLYFGIFLKGHPIGWHSANISNARPGSPGHRVRMRPDSYLVAKGWRDGTVSHMRNLVALLEHKNSSVTELKTERPGYVLYEDDHQVVAMPFESETF